jgi:hypothetical protein
MRRNSENLLLLAGHDNPRKWSDAVPLADVARAAISEIEQYSRITLNIPPGISLVGHAVSDVVHLLAELIENATTFSSKDTQVLVATRELASGGVLIEIVDRGIGISDARLGEMNARLDDPPAIDVSVSRHMGLFAVARLAGRHQVRVRLRPAAAPGLSALVWLPDGLIQRGNPLVPAGSWSARRPDALAHPVRVAALSSGAPSAVAPAAAPFADTPSTAVPFADGPSSGAQLSQSSQPGTRAASGWFRGGQDSGPSAAAGPSIDPGTGTGLGLGAGPGPGSGGASPVQGDRTATGLPVRVPKASMDPRAPAPAGGAVSSPSGSEGRQGTAAGGKLLPQRSPEHARSRLAGFQRGTRRAEVQGGDGGRPPRAGEGAER